MPNRKTKKQKKVYYTGVGSKKYFKKMKRKKRKYKTKKKRTRKGGAAAVWLGNRRLMKAIQLIFFTLVAFVLSNKIPVAWKEKQQLQLLLDNRKVKERLGFLELGVQPGTGEQSLNTQIALRRARQRGIITPEDFTNHIDMLMQQTDEARGELLQTNLKLLSQVFLILISSIAAAQKVKDFARENPGVINWVKDLLTKDIQMNYEILILDELEQKNATVDDITELDDTKNVCAICYSSFELTNENGAEQVIKDCTPIKLRCRHIFCKKCITSWSNVAIEGGQGWQEPIIVEEGTEGNALPEIVKNVNFFSVKCPYQCPKSIICYDKKDEPQLSNIAGRRKGSRRKGSKRKGSRRKGSKRKQRFN